MARAELVSEVTGKVWKIALQPGASVQEGDAVMILESMKMEIPIEATASGMLVEICVAEDDQVEEDQVVAIIEY